MHHDDQPHDDLPRKDRPHDDQPRDDRPQDGLHHTLDVGLAAAADDIEVGDPIAMLGDVRSTVRHRRRRRQAITGVAAAGALVVSGAVLANVLGSDGSDLLISAPGTESVDTTVDSDVGTDGAPDSVPADTDGDAVAPTATDPATDAATDPVPADVAVAGEPLLVAPSRTEALVDGGLSVEQRSSGGAQLFSWQDGFLAVYQQYTPQPLPTELPESVSEQFPQEVQDLFVDGLPPTIDEAISMLQEAGLYDVVADIVTSDPAVQDAIYGVQSEPVVTVRTSVDGQEWSDVDVAFPVPPSRWASTASTDDRFVIVAQNGGGFGGGPDAETDAEPTVDVWSSTDLITWESQTIALPTAPPGQSDLVISQSFVRPVAATDEGWVLVAESFVDIDTAAILESEGLAQSDGAQQSIGTSTDDEGITIEITEFDEEFVGDFSSDDAPPSGPEVVITKTWAELGLDGSPYDEPPVSVAYTSTWGGDAQPIPPAASPIVQSGQVVAAADGFVAFGEDLALSSDGVTWSPVQLPVDGYVDWMIDTPDELLLSVSTFDGTAARYRFDPASSEFTPVDLGDTPTSAYAEQRDRRGVVLVDFGDSGGDVAGSGGTSAVAEIDGYRFELEIRTDPDVDPDSEVFGTVTYSLTDIASGDVVSTETIGMGDFEFEFAREDYDIDVGDGDDGREGFHLFDPATGEELVQVPYSAMTFVSLDADGNAIEGSETVVPDEDEYTNPDQWLVASVGDSLIVEQLEVEQPDGSAAESGEGFDGGRYLGSVAVGADVAILSYSDGSIVRVLPDS